MIDLNAAFRTLQYTTGRIRNVAAFADRRMNAKLELFSHRDLDLRVFARRAKDANTFNATFRPHDRELFLASVLTRL